MDQQDKQKQKQNKRGIFIDFETLHEAESSIDIAFGLTIMLFLLAIIGTIIVNNIIAQTIFFVIAIISMFIIGAIIDSHSALNKFKPKVKKIIKETIIYEDGQTEETKYEY